MVEKLMVLAPKTFNLVDDKTVSIKEQTLFKANGEEGLHLWEASIVLSRWLILNNENLTGKSLLELGSGCGLLGIAILKFTNIGSLKMTDYIDSVLDNLKINVETNSSNHTHSVDRFEMKEKELSKINNCPLCYKRLQIDKLNWFDYELYNSKKEEEKFDIIVGTELVYQGGPLKELAHLIKYLLRKNGVCYISMPLQRSMTSTFQGFLNEIDLEIETQKLDDERLYSKSISDKKEDVKLFEDLKKMNITLYIIRHKMTSDENYIYH